MSGKKEVSLGAQILEECVKGVTAFIYLGAFFWLVFKFIGVPYELKYILTILAMVIVTIVAIRMVKKSYQRSRYRVALQSGTGGGSYCGGFDISGEMLPAEAHCHAQDEGAGYGAGLGAGADTCHDAGVGDCGYHDSGYADCGYYDCGDYY